MHEKEINIVNKNERLSGTLCLPEETGSFPTVLMIHGSGDLDRDGNSKSLKMNVFNVIAHRLAKNGIASFRYDKRGTGKSEGDFYSTGHFQLIDDAKNCLDYLIENNQCNKKSIFLLGHSEGTIIVPRLAQDSNVVSGIILLCPFIDNLESIMMKQASSIKKSAGDLSGFEKYYIKLLFSIFDPVKSQKKLIRKIKVTSKEVVYSMFQKIPAKWVRELISVDPPKVYSSVACSSLIIGGSKDIQCTPNEVKTIEGLIEGNVETHIIENMSHILRLEPDKPSVFNYPKLLKEPIDENMVGLISRWINREVQTANE